MSDTEQTTQETQQELINSEDVDARELSQRRANEVAQSQGDLVAMAISQDLDVEKLRALIDMRNKEEERKAKQEYDRHFAEMQADFEAAKRTKQGYDYKYAPIEVLQRQYGPTIARHGFSYRWREEALEGGAKRVILRISGHGHAEENFFDVPPIEGTKQMNPIQVAGAMSTYGRRYTFIAGFGIIIDDEDDDAQSLTFDQGVKYAEYVEALQGESDIETLRSIARQYHGELKKKGDQEGAELIHKVFTRRKEELEGNG